jgi:hypothetical protein
MEVSYASGDAMTYSEANSLLKYASFSSSLFLEFTSRSRGPTLNSTAQITFTLWQTYLDDFWGDILNEENENAMVPREFRYVAPDLTLSDHFAPFVSNDPGPNGERMADFTALYDAAKRVFVDWPAEFSTSRLRRWKTREPTSTPTVSPSVAPTDNAANTEAPTDTFVFPSPATPSEPTDPPPSEAPTPIPTAPPTMSPTRAPTATRAPTTNSSNVTNAPTDGETRINFPLSWLLFGLAGLCSVIFLVVIFGVTYYYRCRKVKEMQYHLIHQTPEDTLSLFPSVPSWKDKTTALEVDDSY